MSARARIHYCERCGSEISLRVQRSSRGRWGYLIYELGVPYFTSPHRYGSIETAFQAGEQDSPVCISCLASAHDKQTPNNDAMYRRLPGHWEATR